MTEYKKPQKDGFYTRYPDGTYLFGTWSERLNQWEKLRNEDPD